MRLTDKFLFPKNIRLILSCEHGGNQVPTRYQTCFTHAQRVLESHRGYDIGALICAKKLARRSGAALISATVTRLLVDLNRSISHKGLYSAYVAGLDAHEKDYILDHYYHPYRNQVLDAVSMNASRGIASLHFSIHSFTPLFKGERRHADIGLLYDPARAWERNVCHEYAARLRSLSHNTILVRRNYPYRGTADGLTKMLRSQFKNNLYAGIELEINQKIFHPVKTKELKKLLDYLGNVMLELINK
jgi:predicted N-formylglutamate amidohydrolase